MANAKLLREKAKAVHNKRIELARKVEAENRDFTDDENATDAQLKAEHDTLINLAKEDEARFENGDGEPRLRLPVGNDALPGARNEIGGQPTGLVFRDSHGDRVQCFRPTDRIGDGGEPGALGDSVLRMYGRGITNAAYGDSDEDGGYLLPGPQIGRVLDRVRAASVVSRAGAVTVPMNRREMTLATVESDPTVTWRAERQEIPASTPTFGQITLTAKALGCIVPVTVEMVEDAANARQIIEDVIVQSMAAELDRAALKGSGAGAEPRGIVNAAGLNTVTTVGTPDDYSDLVSAVQKILTANYAGEVSDLSLIYDPAIEAVYQGLVTSTEGQPLVPPKWVSDLRKYRTTKIGTADMLVGDFSQLAIGLRTSLRLQILPAGTVADTDGTSWNAASQLLFHVRAYLRADVGVLRPAFFTHLSGVTTGA